MYYRQNPLDEFKKFFSRSTLLKKLIIINVVVFIFINVVNLFFWLFQIANHPEGLPGVSFLAYYLSVPSSLEALIQRPWTLFTYMFLHESFLHILFNMIVLYFGGRIFMEYLSEKKLLSTYILGGLTGAFFYIAAFNFFPVFGESLYYSVALGASASVLAILIAVSTYVPEYSVVLFLFGRVKLKYLALIIILIDLLSIMGGNSGGHIAHLGGAFWGFIYVYLMKRGKDLTLNFGKMNFRRFFKFFTKPKKQPEYRSNFDPGRPLTDEEYNARKNVDQDRIDRILEKISRSGYSSLSKEEKEMLFQSSKKQN
jgi:membrane associated rhomboid family serine protease